MSRDDDRRALTTDPIASRQDRVGRWWRAIATLLGRAIVDAVVVGLFVVALAVVFLATGYPRWAFYAALALGVLGWVWFTSDGDGLGE